MRPSKLIYAVDKRPPWPKLVALGLQHTLLICAPSKVARLLWRAARPGRAV